MERERKREEEGEREMNGEREREGWCYLEGGSAVDTADEMTARQENYSDLVEE